MPTYEYVCIDCGTHVEVSQRITDDPLTTCEVCGGRLRKVFHPAGILFKGSGFYRTDNRKKSSSSSSSSSASSEGSGSSGSGSSGKSSSESASSSSGSQSAKGKSD